MAQQELTEEERLQILKEINELILKMNPAGFILAIVPMYAPNALMCSADVNGLTAPVIQTIANCMYQSPNRIPKGLVTEIRKRESLPVTDKMNP